MDSEMFENIYGDCEYVYGDPNWASMHIYDQKFMDTLSFIASLPETGNVK